LARPVLSARAADQGSAVLLLVAISTTELDSVFYRTPTEVAVTSWREQTPDDFVFAWKASKFITHWKRLSERCENSLDLLDSRLTLLGSKAGPVLFQFPPNFELDEFRLVSFIKMLNPKWRYAFEFRHSSWYTERIDAARCRGKPRAASPYC
jgi:uncharacterized protein YecE (DUF72 family)